MKYFDTSYIARCYIEDPGWEKVRALAGTEPVGCCILGRAETAAALHRKYREGSLSASEYSEIAEQFRDDCDAGLWNWFPVDEGLASSVAEVFRTLPAGVFIRGADALHICCARKNSFAEVYSHDRHSLSAAPHFGLSGIDVI